MKLLALATLFSLTCSSGGSIARVQGTGGSAARVEVRVENNNWNEARVYLLLGADLTGRRRIATVTASMEETVFLRPISSTFRFYVTFLAERSGWVSEEWNDQSYTCFKVVIHNYLNHSYVIPCPRRLR